MNTVWALVYTLSSMALGWFLKRVFKFPAWSVPAICFNNTTALPLLLIQSLETSGILKDLTIGGTDTSSAAASRAKSYFLASAIVGNSLTFAIGPKLLDDEETPDEHHDQKQKKEHKHANGLWESDEEHASPINCSGRTAEEQEEHVNETTTLLPDQIARRSGDISHEAAEQLEKQWIKLPQFVSPYF
jgi:auxin efflux carrier family protein